jgi:Helicase associated domain/Helicase conserved C-terminal domain
MPTNARPSGPVRADYVSGEMPTGERRHRLTRLANPQARERALLANARCLAEGVDVPTLDGVAFIDPRRSEVDIVQAVGRAIRKAPDKKIGTIVLPVFIDAEGDADQVLDQSAFKPVWDVLKALRSHDDELSAQLDALRTARGRTGTSGNLPTKIVLDLPTTVGTDFVDRLTTRIVDATTTAWEFWFGLLLSRVEESGTGRVPKEEVVRGFKLGAWAGYQRVLYAKGRLAADRVSRLSAVPGWTWNQLEAQWEEGFDHLVAFVHREGTARVPPGCIASGYRLGQWVAVQRARHRSHVVEADRAARLEALPGWSWTPRDELWEQGFQHLLDFVSREGHTSVPATYLEDRYALGRWVKKQRNTLKGKPGDERAGRLAALPGWSWDPFGDQWEQGFNVLLAFAQSEGNCRVPRNHVEAGFRLGGWVGNQRHGRTTGQLSLDRQQRLDAVPGWNWNVNLDRWEEGLAHLATFVAREHHARVPVDHIEDGYKLGQWARTQRVFFAKGQLEADQIARLEQQPGWSWDPFSGQWERGFAYLEAFIEREGHARVPRRHIEGTTKLGNWVSNQRVSHSRGDLRPQRVARLQSLPDWEWTPRKGPRPGRAPR